MSFGGHALDMIMRSKLNRDQLRHRRDKTKENQRYKFPHSSNTRKIPPEQIDRMHAELKQYAKEKESYITRISLFISGGFLLAAIIIWLIFR